MVSRSLIRTAEISLWLVTLASLVLSVWIVSGRQRSQESPRASPRTPAAAAESAVADTAEEPAAEPRLPELLRVARRPLRTRLFDPPPEPPPKAPEKRRPPPPRVRVVGTILSSDPLAMIEGERSRVELKRVGETVGDEGNLATIVAIEKAQITLEHAGENVTVPVEGRSR